MHANTLSGIAPEPRLSPVAQAASAAAGPRDPYDDGMTDATRASRRLALNTIYKPISHFVGGASNLWQFIVRVIRRIIHRVASTFGVKAEMSSDIPREGDSPSVNFVAEPGDPEGEAKVLDAAMTTASELSGFVSKLIERKQHMSDISKTLSSDDGEAYLALVLSEVGAPMVALRQKVADKTIALTAVAAEIAQSLGVSPESVLSLMDKGTAEGSALMGHPKVMQALEDMKSLEQDQTALMKLQFSFCDHAIAALRTRDLESPLIKIAKDNVSKFADEDMATIIFDEALKENPEKPADFDGNSALPTLNSQKIDDGSLLTQDAGSAQVPTSELVDTPAPIPVKRKSRAGMSAGLIEFFETPPDDSVDESSNIPRERG
jgi:hypothetical protein